MVRGWFVVKKKKLKTLQKNNWLFFYVNVPLGELLKNPKYFLNSDPYIGSQGGQKFLPPGVPPKLKKTISWPFLAFKQDNLGVNHLVLTQRICWGQKFFTKNSFVQFLPLGVPLTGTLGVQITKNFILHFSMSVLSYLFHVELLKIPIYLLLSGQIFLNFLFFFFISTHQVPWLLQRGNKPKKGFFFFIIFYHPVLFG